VRNISDKTKDVWLAVGRSLFAATAFYFSTKATLNNFDYTGKIASALFHGHLGLETRPGSWLNKMVACKGKYYSVFPLGAGLSAVARQLGSISFS
jgi:hypothetical protein